ncbi:MAG: Selenocysteine-containing peroxiredoxin PrxU [Calditrichaeota bacterium]|nr:Selenocysteine-containing peroxiredoxin PrxU [Calditrichota bacterium]
MAVMVGKEAPTFSAMAYLKDRDDFETVDLEGLRDKWVVLMFYPADFTFVCPTELVSVAKHYDELKKKDVEVLSISTDSHFVHKMWNEVELSKMYDGGLPYPMLYDAGGRIGAEYGVFDQESAMDGRGTFLIDPDGILQSVMITSPGVGRSAKELVRQIDAYQYGRKHSGKVVPADWEEGSDALDPSLKLVGHVCDVA